MSTLVLYAVLAYEFKLATASNHTIACKDSTCTQRSASLFQNRLLKESRKDANLIKVYDNAALPVPQKQTLANPEYLQESSVELLRLDPLPQDSRPRPLLTSHIGLPRGGNGHASTHDGRLFMMKHSRPLWRLTLFKPESLTYDSQGNPNFNSAFSDYFDLEGSPCGGENGVAFCFPDRNRLWERNADKIVYEPYVFDMTMGNLPGKGKLRRRKIRVEVENPFTSNARISAAEMIEGCTYIKNLENLKVIEPTITADGQLMVVQTGGGHPDGSGLLYYTYTENPCSLDWQEYKPLHMMHFDTKIDKRRYAIALSQMVYPDGTKVSNKAKLKGAYPWLDHDGRNLFYTAVGCKTFDRNGKSVCSAVREAESVIGGDTAGKFYHIDGQPNFLSSRTGGDSILFTSGPMWNFERERLPRQMLSPGQENHDKYLPVTRSHEVQPIFGSNTKLYSEINLIDVWKARHFDIIFLPFNELVGSGSARFDLTRSPDLSGNFHTATLDPSGSSHSCCQETDPQTNMLVNRSACQRCCQVTEQIDETQGEFGKPHSVGRALRLNCGNTGAVATLSQGLFLGAPVTGLTIQFSLWIDSGLSRQRKATLLKHKNFEVSLDETRAIICSLSLSGRSVSVRTAAVSDSEWHHFAGRLDVDSLMLAVFVDGVLVGEEHVNDATTIQLEPGFLSIGGSGQDDPDYFFQGFIDEVRFFGHARHHRSICKSAFGASCDLIVHNSDMQKAKLLPVRQHPDCNTAQEMKNYSAACAAAFHNICAIVGSRALESSKGCSVASGSECQALSKELMHAFDIKVPMFGTHGQMHGNSLAQGTPIEKIDCGPTDHLSRAAEWYELTRFESECLGELDATSDACRRAYSLWCREHAGQRYNTGALFHVTARAWISCFNARWAPYCLSHEGRLPTGSNTDKFACFTPSFEYAMGASCSESAPRSDSGSIGDIFACSSPASGPSPASEPTPTLVPTNPATPKPTLESVPNPLRIGNRLLDGQQMLSKNGQAQLAFVGGNLVLRSQDRVLWSSETRTASRLQLQSDGNLVLRGADGKALWASNTVDTGAERLEVQGDCNLVLYGPSGAVWATSTTCR